MSSPTAATVTAATEERGQYNCKRRSYCSSTTAIVLCTEVGGRLVRSVRRCVTVGRLTTRYIPALEFKTEKKKFLYKKRRLAIFIQ